MDIKINDIIEVIYVTGGLQHIKMGRVFNLTKRNLYLDISKEFVELDETLKIRRKDIQNIRKVENKLWR